MAYSSFLVNSHYRIPWIVYKTTYSFPVSTGDYLTRRIAHNLPFIPLLIGQWSDNANFNPSYDISIDIPGGAIGGQPRTVCQVSADTSNITFTVINNGEDRTFYFKIMAFAPPDYTGQVTPVDYPSKFRFNSHYRYQSIYMAGRAAGNSTVTHGLGYLPQVRFWAISNDGRIQAAPGVITTSTAGLDASELGYYYHIYKDILDDAN